MKNKYSVHSVFLTTAKQHIWVTLGTIAAIIMSAACALVAPLILGKAVDRLSTGIPVSIQLVMLYFVFTILSGFLAALKEALITIFGQKMTHSLRSAMSDKLYHLPASYFVKNDPGQISSRFVNDVDTVEDLFSSGIISMISDLVSVVSIMIVIFMKSTGLGILLLIALPLIFAVTRIFQKRMLKAQIASRRAIARTNGHIPDTLHNMRAAHVFHAEHFLERKYSGYIEDNYRAMEKSNFYDAIYSPIVVTTSSIVIAVMMSLAAQGGRFIALFGMSVGTAVTVISYVGKVFDPLESIGMEIQSIQSAMAGIVRIREFMTEPERDIPCEGSSMANEGTAVNIRDVTFGYTMDKPVLRGFSLVLEKGDRVTLAGRTGCGKSTLLKLILGLYKPQAGTVQIFGRDVSTISDEERRKVFGYVEQTFVPVPGTVRDQLTLGDPRVSSAMIDRALRIVDLDHEIKKLENGLDTVYDPSLFSQGQLQLLSAARAIVMDPSILLLDEINASLDADTELHLNNALRNASQGRTVISISHRLSEQTDSRIIRMDAA